MLSGLRMIGPVLGYALALVFLSHYVNLTEETTLKPSDPAWIGAWWLGASRAADAHRRPTTFSDPVDRLQVSCSSASSSWAPAG